MLDHFLCCNFYKSQSNSEHNPYNNHLDWLPIHGVSWVDDTWIFCCFLYVREPCRWIFLKIQWLRMPHEVRFPRQCERKTHGIISMYIRKRWHICDNIITSFNIVTYHSSLQLSLSLPLSLHIPLSLQLFDGLFFFSGSCIFFYLLLG